MSDLRFAVLYGLTLFVPGVLSWFAGRYWALAYQAGQVPLWSIILVALVAITSALAGMYCRKALLED